MRLTNGHLPKLGALGDPRRQRRAQPGRLRRRWPWPAAPSSTSPASRVVTALLYLVLITRHLERRRGPPQGRRPPRHRRRRRRLPPRHGAAGLGRVDGRRQRHRGPVGRVLHQLDAQRRRRGRRRAARDRRHAADHPRRRGHLDPDRPVHRDLPRRVRRGQAPRARHHVPRRRDDRHPVDRRRPVRLRAVRALLRSRHPHGHHGLGRAGRADDPRRRPLQRGDAAPRAERAARGGLRARRAEVADDREGRAADLDRRHHHGHHALDLARHRRDRAAAASRPA